MKTIFCIAVLLFALPALAVQINDLPPDGTPVAAPVVGIPNLADKLNEKLFANTAVDTSMPTPPRRDTNEPLLPSAPPPVTYDVWVYHWNGQQYVKQDKYTMQTTDIRKAAAYWNQCNNFAGWAARANAPDVCATHIVTHDPTMTNDMAVSRPPQPPLPTFNVWAYSLKDGKWVKDEKYSWTTKDPVQGSEYTNKVNAVPGWYATNNCPLIVPESQRFYEGGLVHGSPARNYYYNADGDIAWDETYHYHHLYGLNGWTSYLQHLPTRAARNATQYVPSPSYDSTPSNDSFNDTQNMINNQNMLNNIQDMINTQNMINQQQSNP